MYSLWKQWSLVGASSAGVTFSVAGQETAPNGIAFSDDGLQLYVVGIAIDAVFQYTLAVPYDLRTATYTQSYSVAAQGGNPTGIFIHPDGTGFYLSENADDAVDQYAMSTPWDISTSSFVASFSVVAQTDQPFGLYFSPDGFSMYVVGWTFDKIYQYTLGTAWTISTAAYASKSLSVATQDTLPYGAWISSDGLNVFVIGGSTASVYRYTLSTAWDISTGTFAQRYAVGAVSAAPRDIWLTPYGDRMYIVDAGTDAVHVFNMGVAFDPEWDYQNIGAKIENRHRTRSGAEYIYKWGGYDRIKFSARFVDSATHCTVNSWWGGNTELLFMEQGTTNVVSCHIVNRDKPFGSYIKPYRDLYQGVIELGGY